MSERVYVGEMQWYLKKHFLTTWKVFWYEFIVNEEKNHLPKKKKKKKKKKSFMSYMWSAEEKKSKFLILTNHLTQNIALNMVIFVSSLDCHNQ